ncbi:MAG: hypothetical protein M1829_002104 [Trizodia sp. TS-e1964]|nr:MAG: hypothetical protein M1829_002104 [Trizodia sp. TS-e1964]
MPDTQDNNPNFVTEPLIKPDPDFFAATPSALTDEDIYEDAGDLELSCARDGLQLMRIPRYLWDVWSKFADDEEIELGTVRVFNSSSSSQGKMKLRLHSSVEKNKGLPKHYNLFVTNMATTNLFVFTEKDLSNFSSKSKTRTRNAGDESILKFPPIPARLLHPEQNTKIEGTVTTEINCLPLENEEYSQLMVERTKLAAKPKRETKYLKHNIHTTAGDLLAPGTLGGAGNFGAFIKTTGLSRGKAPNSDHKAARIPQNELLDLIFACFKRYNYWSLKALKLELNQPEAYLKSTLDKVAQLVRSGTYAMTWMLKPESRVDGYDNVKDEQAPELGYGLDGAADELGNASDIGEAADYLDSGRNNINERFEDVKMENF